MATTALFVELIVIGVQGLVWLALGALVLFSPQAVTGLASQVQGAGVIGVVLLLATAYTLGVILDRTYHVFAETIGLAERMASGKWVKARAEMYLADNMMEIYAAVGMLTPYYQYLVGRWRIARATCFNLALTVVFASTYGVVRHDPFVGAGSATRFGLIIALLLVFTVLSAISFSVLDRTLRIRGEQILGLQSGRVQRTEGTSA